MLTLYQNWKKQFQKIQKVKLQSLMFKLQLPKHLSRKFQNQNRLFLCPVDDTSARF